MNYPPLVKYDTLGEYIRHYNDKYCKRPIITFDGIEVRFRKDTFTHCFYESSKKNRIKDTFSRNRAERIDWIKAALEDSASERYAGWDRTKKRYSYKRRVAVVKGNYVVVISISKNRKAKFITAYVADSTASKGREVSIDKIRKSPVYK